MPEVHAATIERIRDDAGEIGEFARRIVRGDGVLTVAQVWHAWCEHNGEPMNAQAPGGIGRRSLSKALSDYIFDLGKPRQITVDGNNFRGWRGWRLLTEEEAQRATAEQAEKTQPAADYAPSPEAEQAIRALLAGLSDAFSILDRAIEPRIVPKILHMLDKPESLTAVRQVVLTSAEQARMNIRKVFANGDLRDCRPNQLREAITHLALETLLDQNERPNRKDVRSSHDFWKWWRRRIVDEIIQEVPILSEANEILADEV